MEQAEVLMFSFVMDTPLRKEITIFIAIYYTSGSQTVVHVPLAVPEIISRGNVDHHSCTYLTTLITREL
jgi:hypothetical protein